MKYIDLRIGDCRDILRQMANDGVKVQMCVTSPPYFGLRDYGVDGQLGLEQTPDEYVAALVEVFRGVWDVLADDGTLWLNIGDSYAGSNKGVMSDGSVVGGVKQRTNKGTITGAIPKTAKVDGCKPKDLIGIPWMLAFALRADGWYLRQDIIWHKPNPMPESVRDRCTKAHEYIFLLTKKPKYFINSEGMKEAAVGSTKGRGGSFKRTGSKRGVEGLAPNSPTATHREDRPDVSYDGPTRNRRTVWTVATRPYKGAHFAVFPPDLIEPCIHAGTSERGHCPKCGARWVRDVELTPMVIAKTERNEERGTRTGTSGTMLEPAQSVTVGWSATCECGADPVPDIVLDPFGGSGTTAGVAAKHGRSSVLIELNGEYAHLVSDRVESVVGHHVPIRFSATDPKCYENYLDQRAVGL